MAGQIRSSEMKRALFAFGQFVGVGRAVRCYSAYFQMITKPGEIARLYRDLSLFPSLNRADVGPVVTSQYGGKYTNIYTGKSYSTVFRCICICVLAFNTVSLTFLLQNGLRVTWREMRKSSFADSILFSMMISQWSSLEPQGTVQRLKESM